MLHSFLKEHALANLASDGIKGSLYILYTTSTNDSKALLLKMSAGEINDQIFRQVMVTPWLFLGSPFPVA